MFLSYPTNVTAPLGSNVTLECVANQPVLDVMFWTLNDIQLVDDRIIQSLTEDVSDGTHRTAITLPASVRVNETIDEIVC